MFCFLYYLTKVTCKTDRTAVLLDKLIFSISLMATHRPCLDYLNNQQCMKTSQSELMQLAVLELGLGITLL